MARWKIRSELSGNSNAINSVCSEFLCKFKKIIIKGREVAPVFQIFNTAKSRRTVHHS